MNYLGIDYGKVKIGLAISEGSIASPYEVISNSGWPGKLKEIIQKEKIGKIIVGMSENKTAEDTEEFITALKKEVTITIESADETLTTRNAIDSMIQSGRSRGYRKEMEDAVAAAIMLQNYLDNKF